MSTAAPPLKDELGNLLRHWRDRRRFSQLSLSMESGVSQRHISFIESGRSVPSRHTLLSLARRLDVPLRDRNAMLLAAGYAPIYPEDDLDASAMRGIRVALRRMLHQQEPFPALVLDRSWNVVMANAAAPSFFSRFVDLSRWPRPRNLLDLVFDPAGLRPSLGNWAEVVAGLAERVRRESIGRIPDETTKRLSAALASCPGADRDGKATRPAPTMPTVPLIFERSGTRLSFFSLVTTVGTPRTVTAQELRLECMFPADEETERDYPAFLETTPPISD